MPYEEHERIDLVWNTGPPGYESTRLPVTLSHCTSSLHPHSFYRIYYDCGPVISNPLDLCLFSEHDQLSVIKFFVRDASFMMSLFVYRISI